jgi:sugar lactone lactonase YvrE
MSVLVTVAPSTISRLPGSREPRGRKRHRELPVLSPLQPHSEKPDRHEPPRGIAVTSDADGNVSIAANQLFSYDKSVKLIGQLEIPERPSSLAWGGPDHKTLCIGARSSIHAIQANAKGE